MSENALTHTRLKALAERFREDPSDANSDRLIAEFVLLYETGKPVIAAGIRNSGGELDPAGNYARDGRYYYYVFSDADAFRASGIKEGASVVFRNLADMILQTEKAGGIVLDVSSEGAPRIPKEDIAEGIRLYERLHKK